VQIILVEMELNVPLWMDITSAHVREDLKENFVTSTLMSATTALVCMEAVKIPMVDTNVTVSLDGLGRTVTVSTILVTLHLVSMVENVTEQGDTNTLAHVRMDSTEPTAKTISTIVEEIYVKMEENVGMGSTLTPATVLPTGLGNIVLRMLTSVPSVVPVRTMEPAGTQKEATNAFVSTVFLGEIVRSTKMIVLSIHV